ncbi:MAG: carbohydrate ABC transporter permease [Ktedonobacterales bacterium]
MASTAQSASATGAQTGAAATAGTLGQREHNRINVQRLLLYTILVIYSIFSLGPFVFALISSFKTEGDVLATPPTLIPNPATLHSYQFIFSNGDFPFPNYIFNSLIYGVATAALNVVLAAMAGYAFGRMEFPGRNLLFALTLAVLMIPGYLIMIPKFLVVNSLGLTDSLWALIIPAAVTPTAVFLMTQFLKTLPRELEESAMIDGAGRFRTFWQIIFPLIRPAMVTVALLQFQAAWNDFIWPLLVMSSKYNYTLTVGLTFFKGVHYTQYSLLLAGAAINIAPLVIIFFIFQRYFMTGISTSGLAGR